MERDYIPLYMEMDIGAPKPVNLDNYRPGFWTEMGAYFKSGWNLNPVPSLSSAYDVMSKSSGVDLGSFEGMSDADMAEFAGGDNLNERMPLEAQEEFIRENGLEGRLKADEAYTGEALRVLADAKKREILNAEIIERGGHGVLGLGASLAAGMLDPINFASAFVPVVGEQRVLSMLRNANGALGRAAARAKIGAASGAAGAALVEPVILGAQTLMQADYNMYNSFMNLGFGATLGAGLHSAGGAIGDAVRARKGRAQPWEYVPPDDGDTTLMREFEERMYRHRRDASLDADPAALREEARAAAELFNIRARSWARHERKSLREYYDNNMPEFRSWQEAGEIDAPGEGGETLFHAVYRNKAASIDEFFDSIAQPQPNNRQSYYDFQGRLINRAEDNIEGYKVLLVEERANHIRKRHEDFNAWEKIPEIIEKGEKTAIGMDSQTQLPSYAYFIHENDNIIAVLAAPAQNRILGKHFKILTAFNSTEKRFHNWLKENKKAVDSQSAGISPAPPSTGNIRELSSGSLNGKQNINADTAQVNKDIAFNETGEASAATPSNNLPSRNAEERAKSLAAETEDVSRQAQIVLYDGDAPAGMASAKSLPQRFAEMPFVDADTARFFGEGKAIPDDGFISTKHLIEYAKKEFGTGRKFINEDTSFEIIVTVKSIRNTIHHGLNEAKAFSVPFIPEIIRSGLYLGIFDKSPHFKSLFFANKLRLNGKDYVVGFVVREDANGNRFYDHELTEIIDPDSLSTSNMIQEESYRIGEPRANQGHIMTILRETLGVNDKSGTIMFQGPAAPSVNGRKARLISPTSYDTVRYEVRELDDILASHDPENSFAKSAGYPEKAQERPYHSDVGEQEKVFSNASRFEPAFILSDAPDLSSGPPVVTRSGIVLGGNSRTMSLKLVYARDAEKAAAYREALLAKAGQFGLDAGRIEGMRKPVLVRALSGDLSVEEMAKRSRQYNQSFTQNLQAEAEAISRARFVGGKSIGALAQGIRDGKTVNEFLAGADSADFAKILLDEGVIQQNEYSSLTTKSGALNEMGKARVTQILRGLVLPDYDLMTKLPKKTLANLDAAIPGLAQSRLRGEGFDLTGAFYDAMNLVATARKNGRAVSSLFEQATLHDNDPLLSNPVIQALAMLFDKAEPREIRLRLEHFIKEADVKGAGQNLLVPQAAVSPSEAFRKAFLEDLAFVDNERVINFDPKSNIEHAAILWAAQNGNKMSRPEKLIAKIDKRLKQKNLKEEERKILIQHKNNFVKMSGELGILKAKLPETFQKKAYIVIPEPKKPGEAGALPELGAEPGIRDEFDMADPDAPLGPRAQVGFDMDGAKLNAVVTFFKSADVSSAPHELFHIFRREIEMSAKREGASQHAKDLWKDINEFVGAKEGQAWTREMEERFADGGLRYLAEGKAPGRAAEGLFARLKEWLMDLYLQIDRIGVEISPAMRKTFDAMFTVPHDQAERMLRGALADNAQVRIGSDLADPDQAGGKFLPEDAAALAAEEKGQAAMINVLEQDARQNAENVMARLERDNPELAREVFAEEKAELAAIEQAEKRLDDRDELGRQALECMVNGGI